jgi:hypothetical protein
MSTMSGPGPQQGYIPVNGHNIAVPVSNPNINHQNRVKTPEWMISIDDLMNSTIENFEDHAELFGWYAEQSRITEGSAANNLFSTATVQHSNVIIVIPNNIYGPTLEFKMNSGANIAKIHIVRLSNVGDLKVPLQEINYTNCRVESIQQELDKLIISFRPETRENTVIKYKQDGSKEGQAVTKFDYTKGSGE